MSESKPTLIFDRALVCFIAFTAMLCVSMAWTLSRGSAVAAPPAPWNVDGVFYDNIAFNLNEGNGFAVDLKIQPWRGVYREAGNSLFGFGEYDWLMPLKGAGPTALRSPGYVFTIAAIYRVFGKRYVVGRYFGCAFVSLGIALLLTFCATRWGYLPAVIAAVTLSADFSVMQSAGTLASESLAILVLAITFLLAVRAWETPTHGRWFLVGVGLRKRVSSRKWSHFAVFLVTAIVFAMPWWVRNCAVTEHFTPFGTAGSCGFVGAYCDESLANHGQWQSALFEDNQREVQATVDMDSVSLAHLEYLTGQASLQKTKQWCTANWSQIPKLMAYRALSHWGFFNPAVPKSFAVANLCLVLIGFLGCFYFTDKLRALFVFVLLLDIFLVMLTWEHLGRYAIPIRPVVHIGCGLAIASILEFVKSLRGQRLKND